LRFAQICFAPHSLGLAHSAARDEGAAAKAATIVAPAGRTRADLGRLSEVGR
jgi:hypothetical protein